MPKGFKNRIIRGLKKNKNPWANIIFWIYFHLHNILNLLLIELHDHYYNIMIKIILFLSFIITI
jgi:hypothetical protein